MGQICSQKITKYHKITELFMACEKILTPNTSEQLFPSDKLIGIMAIFTFWDENLYFGQRELQNKPWCGKREGDLGLIMGSIEKGETTIQALKREIEQEIGFQNGTHHDYALDPEPYGYWQTEKGWVAVHVSLVNSQVVMERLNKGELTLRKSQDNGETTSPGIVSSQDLDRFNLRGGIKEVIDLFEQGKRGFILTLNNYNSNGFHSNQAEWGLIYPDPYSPGNYWEDFQPDLN